MKFPARAIPWPLYLSCLCVSLILGPACSKSDKKNPVAPSSPLDYGTGRIVFDFFTPAVGHIYSMNPDGSSISEIPTGLESASNPEISPDGTRIAFGGRRNGNDSLYIMGVDGTNLRAVTSGVGGAAWSPDDSELVYSDLGELHIINAAGGNSFQLPSFYPNTSASPTWSPDGTRIAFEVWSNTSGSVWTDIYAMNANGTGITQVTALSGHETTPDWSPDGSRIAFAHDGFIYTIRPDGSDLKRITPDIAASRYGDFEPDWSPDGTRIVFSSDRTSAAQGDPVALYSVKVDGSGLVQITQPQGGQYQLHASWGIKH